MGNQRRVRDLFVVLTMHVFVPRAAPAFSGRRVSHIPFADDAKHRHRRRDTMSPDDDHEARDAL